MLALQPETGSVRVEYRGRTIARYVFDSPANHPYFDAVTPLEHDGVLTLDRPYDHPWHHGLWFAWKFANDTLFWESAAHDPDGVGPMLGQSRAVCTKIVENSIQQRLAWVDSLGTVFLDEDRVLEFGDDQAGWHIDWAMDFTARFPVRLHATKIVPETPWGGYSGLAYRPARAMNCDELLAAAGSVDPAVIHGSRGLWVAYSGPVDGGDEPFGSPRRGGIRLRAKTPTPIYAYSESFQSWVLMVALSPVMHGDLHLAAGEHLRLEYRVDVIGSAITEAPV
ncbi:MAG: PmoA family protein [Propionibacteriaceae bacterium]|jgi:hypothetical protein|nr:PmoA family protein [Propionibacteriaceae bacterium]